MKISLCLLVWDELAGCQIDVPELPLESFDEVYAVDGGSSDGTLRFLESKGIPVYRQPKKGLNAAYHYAVERSRCDAVVVFFPKGTISTSSLRNFRSLLEDGYDLVIASRNIAGARNEEDDRVLKPRKWATMYLGYLSALLWRREGHLVRDVLHGYKGFTVAGFRKMNPREEGLSIDIEMVIRSYRLRLKRTEFPVREMARKSGASHFHFFSTGKKLLEYLWWEIRRKT